MSIYLKSSIQKIVASLFVIISVLAIANFILIKYYKTRQAKDSALVDASGRNRMLSQKIGFYACQVLAEVPAASQELLNTINLHDVSLTSLKNGGIAPGIANNMQLPAVHGPAQPRLLDAEQLWQQYKANAEVVAHYGPLNSTELPDSIDVDAAMAFIQDYAPEMLKRNNALVKAYVAMNLGKQNELDTLLLLLLLANITVMGLGYYIMNKQVIERIQGLAQAAESVAQGQYLDEEVAMTDPNLARIAQAIAQMGQVIEQSVQFAAHIGQGKFDGHLGAAGNENRLYTQLNKMKEQLMVVAKEDAQRNWTSDGLAHFGELLRTTHTDVQQLCQQAIIALVKYLKANQGAIFSLPAHLGSNQTNGQEPYLELTACYAWGRAKQGKRRVYQNDGLVGRCWIEADTVYLTDVPANFINITSGLGKANPRCIVLVPLKTDQAVLGVLELASFTVFDAAQQAFIEKVAENLAATLASVQTAERTRALLEQSEQQAQALKEQEEAMRQNTEELVATQEEMKRHRDQLLAEISHLKQQLSQEVMA